MSDWRMFWAALRERGPARAAFAFSTYGRQAIGMPLASRWDVIRVGYDLLRRRWVEWQLNRTMRAYTRHMIRVGRSAEKATIAMQRLAAAAKESEKALRP